MSTNTAAASTPTPYKPPAGVRCSVYPMKLIINDKELDVIPMMMPGYVEIIRNRLIKEGKLDAALSEKGTAFIMVKQTQERQCVYYARNGHIYAEILDTKVSGTKLVKIYTDKVAYVGRL